MFTSFAPKFIFTPAQTFKGSVMTKESKLLVVIGTRPEAIKLAPLILECQSDEFPMQPVVMMTGQQSGLVEDVLDFFGVVCGYRASQLAARNLARSIVDCQESVIQNIKEFNPACVVVQGDTISALAGAQAGFLSGVPVVHVEAGLRTNNLADPWPEEYCRQSISLAASLHCADNQDSADNLLAEGVSEERIFITGNPSISALQSALDQLEKGHVLTRSLAGESLSVLITCHRRENFGRGILNLCQAVQTLAKVRPDVQFIFSVHPNPETSQAVFSTLAGIKNVQLHQGLPYPHFIDTLRRAAMVITDSGGVQEEAFTLGVPALIFRDDPERFGGEIIGRASAEKITGAAMCMLDGKKATAPRRKIKETLFGTSQAAEQIAQLIAGFFGPHAWPHVSGICAVTPWPRPDPKQIMTNACNNLPKAQLDTGLDSAEKAVKN